MIFGVVCMIGLEMVCDIVFVCVFVCYVDVLFVDFGVDGVFCVGFDCGDGKYV